MNLIENTSQNKLRGGFYTPDAISRFILKWGLHGDQKMKILEPSCGDGAFLRQIKNGKYKYKSLTAIEIEKSEFLKAKRLNLAKANLINKSFYTYFHHTKEKFDLIIGNPPYIRYQFFKKKEMEMASEIFNTAGIKYSKLTNAWVSFVIGASLLLNKEQSKLGFVVPAEILQVSYAKVLRDFLASYYNKINIISFDKLVFPDIQQEVVLLLCEKNKTNKHLIEHLTVPDAYSLDNLDATSLKSPKKRIDFKLDKWTYYFLTQKEINFLKDMEKKVKIPTLKNFADVEVGITTGANSFFTVPSSTVKKYKLNRFAKPLVGRSVQVPSVIFTEKDWEENKKNEARAHLLSFPEKTKIHKSALAYLKEGKKQKIHKGYKCTVRNEWQIIPSLKVSDAFFIRRNNLFPKLIINKFKAYTTDTMHRVYVKNCDISALTASYYNSVSLAFSEICGRSHGGGVLELMPNETEKILIPYNKNNKKLLPKIDKFLRSKISIDELLEFTNKKILQDNYGLSDKEIQMADNIWKKLRNRRLKRGKRD